MHVASLVIGGLLTLLGVGVWGVTQSSITAMIPAFVGVPLLIIGGLQMLITGPNRRHLGHIGAIIGLLAALAGFANGARVLIKGLSADAPLNGLVLFSTLAMGVLGAVYLYLCIQSFIAARKAREAEAASEATADASIDTAGSSEPSTAGAV